MRIRRYQAIIILCFSIFLSSELYGQWFHDFGSLDLSDWTGDVDDFIVNDEETLQLNASEAGESYLYRSSVLDFDTVSIFLYHRMDFSPSDNNMSKIYLALDHSDPALANGYFLEIGENGSEDALKFYYLDNGTEDLIATASMGALATEPAVVRLQIDIFPNGLWSVYTNYEGSAFTALELEFVDDRFAMSESLFFGVFCKYSASRADKFFYDDVGVGSFVEDLTAPTVVDVEVSSATELTVLFSEPVLESGALEVSNYFVDNGVGNPELITSLGGIGNRFLLSFPTPFDATEAYTLEVSNILDLNENQMSQQTIDFLFADEPAEGELLLSEILFDPYPGGEDFVEIYNRSNKNLNLRGLVIRNDEKEAEEEIGESIIMAADSYLALTMDVDFLLQEYKPDAGAYIAFNDLPDFNNDSGNVMLINSTGEVLDSFNYDEEQHLQLLDDTEGVSLERLSFEVESTAMQNWQSASQNVRFATPGYKNSNFVSISGSGENFLLSKETFSPNQDGEDDQMILQYNLEKSGFVANIQIYDASGFKIKELSKNELLGSEGIITWDGTDSNGQIADIGIYIIAGDAFHSDGDVKKIKLTTVLADFID